jgi:hypothetical protein
MIIFFRIVGMPLRFAVLLCVVPFVALYSCFSCDNNDVKFVKDIARWVWEGGA